MSQENESKEIREIRQAIKEIRRESYKAAFIYAAVEATVALIGVNLILSLFKIKQVPDTVSVPFPDILARAVNWVSLKLTDSILIGYGEPLDVTGAMVVSLVAAFSVFVVDFTYRSYKYNIERFEDVNPKVEEALRTARDTSEDGTENTMARKLYRDVIQDLKSTTSTKLVDDSRIFTTVILILVLSVASFYVALMGVNLNSEDSPLNDLIKPSPDQTNSQKQNKGKGTIQEYQGLKSGKDVLGEKESVTSGSDDLNVGLKTSGGGEGGGLRDSYDNSGYTGGSGDGSGVSSQEAGFEGQKRVEDAEMVKEYNLKIRENEDDEDE